LVKRFSKYHNFLDCDSVLLVQGNDEPNALDDGNLMGNREIVPLDQIQTKPWGPVGNKPQVFLTQ